MIAANDSLVWLAKKRTDKMYLFDLKTEKPVQSLKLDQHTSDGNDEKTVPMFLGPHVAAFGGQRTGDVFIADHRVSPGQWCLDTSHLCEYLITVVFLLQISYRKVSYSTNI